MSNSPKPETTTARLPSEGYSNGRTTAHFYFETRETDVDGPAYEYIFKCSETGAERRWGLIERFSFSSPEEGN